MALRNFQSSLESGDRNHNSLATGRFCIGPEPRSPASGDFLKVAPSPGLDPKELLLAAVYAWVLGLCFRNCS